MITERNRDISITITNKPHLITSSELGNGIIFSAPDNQLTLRNQYLPKDLLIDPNVYAAKIIITDEKVDWDLFAQNVATGYITCINSKIKDEKRSRNMLFVKIGEFTKVDKHIEGGQELIKIQKELAFHNF